MMMHNQQQNNIKPMKNQHQWEGFQAVNDHQEKPQNYIKQTINSTPCKLKRGKDKNHSIVRNNNIHHNKASPSPHKNSPVRKQQVVLIQQNSEKQYGQRLKSTKDKMKPVEPKNEPKVQQKRNRYPPIPIIYDNTSQNYTGRIIYRGLQPKTSDGYFRVLKDVNFQGKIQSRNPSSNIEFNSRFESGNLSVACQYDLHMRVDTNTYGHMQWFYFSVKNCKKGKIKFNVYRFRKMYSLYQRGMKPYGRSRKSGKDWHSVGQNVKYYRQKIINENGVRIDSKYFFLTFTYNFQFENDQVFFAAGIPYTTTFLQAQIQKYQFATMSNYGLKFDVSALCTSLCGQTIELLTIEPKQDPLSSKKKQFIVINARSHSGQTSGSWVLDGLLQQISQNKQIQNWMIINNICFKVVPMLNKDGVFFGNYRTGIVGDDFNRKFSSGQRQFFPQIFALKKLVNKCRKMGNVKLFLDLHGHSILKNNFIFGPDHKSFEDEQLMQLGQQLLHHSKYFSRKSSRYRNQKKKIQTARVYFQFQEQILALTCQNSLGLYYHQCQTFQQGIQDWKCFGKDIIEAMKNILGESQFQKQMTLIKKYSDNLEDSGKVKLKNNLNWLRNNKMKKEVSSTIPENRTIVAVQKRDASMIEMKKTDNIMKPKINRLPSQTHKPSGNCTSPSKISRPFHPNNEKQQEDQQQREQSHIADLKQSLMLTRYEQSPIKKSNNEQFIRASKTVDLNGSIGFSKDMQEQIQISDNFSQEYQSMNDSDSEAEDLQPDKKQELLKCIKQIRIELMGEDGVEEAMSALQLHPLKGFKEYRLNFQHQAPSLGEKRPVQTKLKPLKFQQFKQRGFTQKKIKGNAQIMFSNHSSVISNRIENRLLIHPNIIPFPENKKLTRHLKRQEILSEMFPKIEESQYLVMRIKQIKLQNARQSDKQ